MMKLRLRDCLRLRAWCPTPPQRRRWGIMGRDGWLAGWLAQKEKAACRAACTTFGCLFSSCNLPLAAAGAGVAVAQPPAPIPQTIILIPFTSPPVIIADAPAQ